MEKMLVDALVFKEKIGFSRLHSIRNFGGCLAHVSLCVDLLGVVLREM